VGLKICILHADDDYLGVEIRAGNERYAGTTYVAAGFDELGALADLITGFPAHAQDERSYQFGSREPNVVGGWCRLRFRTSDLAGRAVVEVTIEDDDQLHPKASAALSLPIEAASLDRFIAGLRRISSDRRGEVALGKSGPAFRISGH
jgi:hypothetical protein